MREKDYLLMYDLEKDYWYWLGKKDMIVRLFETYAPHNKKGTKILDVGCGTGLILESLRGEGELYGVDVSNFALRLCNLRGEFKLKKMNAEHLNFPKEFFDVIILSDVIEHVKNDRGVIEGCYTILKKGGIVIVTIPAHKYLWNADDARLKHYRRYEKDMLIKVAKPFKILKLSYTHFFLYPPVLVARFMESFIGEKRDTIEMQIKKGLQKEGLFKSLNWFLLKLNIIENRLLTKINFPQGISWVMILKKN